MQVGKVRFFHDAVALVLHIGALLSTASDPDFFWNTSPGQLLA